MTHTSTRTRRTCKQRRYERPVTGKATKEPFMDLEWMKDNAVGMTTDMLTNALVARKSVRALGCASFVL